MLFMCGDYNNYCQIGHLAHERLASRYALISPSDEFHPDRPPLAALWSIECATQIFRSQIWHCFWN